MRADLLQLAADLARRGEAFAFAVVVRRSAASSTQVGNTAIITESGVFHGWLGGSCVQPTVAAQARLAISEGSARLLSLSPAAADERRPGVVSMPMTCHSGGSVEIYVEPVLPAPRLVIFGVTPVAQALATLGGMMGFAVDAIDPAADASMFPGAARIASEFRAGDFSRPDSQRSRLYAVVATFGNRDEEAIADALEAEPAYLGVVASRKRFAEVRNTLMASGVGPDRLERVTSPAGLDIGAKTPEEVALSILAEIVRVRRAAASVEGPPPVGVTTESERDPVCGMDVEVSRAGHTANHGDRTYYFCCGGCRERFLAAPERYIAALAS